MAIVLGILCLTVFHRTAIEKRYGFITRTPDLRFFPCHIEVLTVNHIKPGGAFSKAGFQEGDIILKPVFNSVSAFHRSLDKPGGTLIEFEIIARDKFIAECDFNPAGKTEIRKVIAP